MTTTERTEDGRAMSRLEEIVTSVRLLDRLRDQLIIERAVMAAIDPIHESYQEARITTLRKFEAVLIQNIGEPEA